MQSIPIVGEELRRRTRGHLQLAFSSTLYVDNPEAAEYPATADAIERLSRQCSTKLSRLGEAGVRGHTIDFVPSAWANVVSLPASVPRTRQDLSR